MHSLNTFKRTERSFALADIVISRAGANAICELLALRKPNILIPLPANASRGDQILNARSFERQGFSIVLEEESLTDGNSSGYCPPPVSGIVIHIQRQ